MQQNTIPEDVISNVREVMAAIDAELLRVSTEDEAPDIKDHMARINTNLRKFPDLVHLLSDDDIAPYYKACLKIADTVLQPAKKKAAAKTAKAEDAEKLQADIDSGNLFGF